MTVVTNSLGAVAAQREAFDRILGNHLLYCTVCDNNNGNCTVHNTTKMLARRAPADSLQAQAVTKSTIRIPSTATTPTSASSAGAASRPARTWRSTRRSRSAGKTSIPRVLWDGGKAIGESSCVSCGHCVTVCPCNALMEKSMLGQAGFLTALPKTALDGMIDVVKAIEPEIGLRLDPEGLRSGVGHARVAHSHARRRSAPTAASVAASMSGPRTGTS